MKKYATLNEGAQQRREAIQQKYDELQMFQFLLRHSDALNATYHGRARAIADGLQPWIDALEETLAR